MSDNKAATAKAGNVFSIGERAVRQMVVEAEVVRTVAGVLGKEPKPGDKLNGIEAGGWMPDMLGLPPDCPVRPLGVSGDRLWFLDAIGQVRALDPPYGKGHVLGLFCGKIDYLTWAWPRWGKEKLINGFANEEAAAALIKACATKGPWEAIDKVRGRGCWTDGGGSLVVHTGDRIYIGGRAEDPGEFDGYVYPTRGRIPKPFKRADDIPFSPAQILRPALRTWNWVRPEIDPHLLLGWIGAGFLGGALPWRPMVFLTGDKGTGKSTLQALVKGLFGDWLIQSADTTAAGLYQHIGLDSVPIGVDELESEADVRKQQAVLKLARLASSGAAMLRGGDRHKGVEFNARSAFLFSSINAPPLPPQDLSRMALLRLDKLKPGQSAPSIDPQVFGAVGRCILTRLIAEWPRFERTFLAFAGELAEAGMDGRGQAQFGTLLTCADMIEFEGWDEARLGFPHDGEGDLVRWRDILAPRGMVEFEDMLENWRLCVEHLLSVRVEAWRGGSRHAVGQVVQAYYDKDDTDLVSANQLLAQAGLRIVFETHDGRSQAYLAVHNRSPLVRALFEGSKWAGELGAGVWSSALRQGPRGHVWEIGQVRINGVQQKATLLSLDGLYGKDGIMREGE